MSGNGDQSVLSEGELTALRAAAAERVMGWNRSQAKWAYESEAWIWCRRDVPVLTCESWRPDEDDAQLMAVVDRMLELGFEMQVRATREVAEVLFRGATGSGQSVDGQRRVAVLKAALGAMAAD